MKDRLPSESWYRSRVHTLLMRHHFYYKDEPLLIGMEVALVGGKRVDILYGSWDPEGSGQLVLTVVEVKRQKASHDALLQLMAYMGRIRLMLNTSRLWGGVRVEGVLAAPAIARSVSDALVGFYDQILPVAVGVNGDEWTWAPHKLGAEVLGEKADQPHYTLELVRLVESLFPSLVIHRG